MYAVIEEEDDHTIFKEASLCRPECRPPKIKTSLQDRFYIDGLNLELFLYSDLVPNQLQINILFVFFQHEENSLLIHFQPINLVQ